MTNLICPAINALIADASFDGFQKRADDANAELDGLVSFIKILQEQNSVLTKRFWESKTEIKLLQETNGRLDKRLSMYNDEPGVGGPF